MVTDITNTSLHCYNVPENSYTYRHVHTYIIYTNRDHYRGQTDHSNPDETCARFVSQALCVCVLVYYIFIIISGYLLHVCKVHLTNSAIKHTWIPVLQ